MSKLRTSVDAFVKSEGVHARLDHLTAMEINGIRPLLPHALDQMLRIQSVSIGFQNISIFSICKYSRSILLLSRIVIAIIFITSL